MDSKKVFKKERETSFDKEQGMLELIPIHQWSLLVLLGLSLFILLLWSIFGTINTRVYGTGVLIPGTGKLYTVSPKYSGVIQEFLVKVGQSVEKGEVIAKIDASYLREQIKNKKIYIANLEQEKEKVAREIKGQRESFSLYQQKLISTLDEKEMFSKKYKTYLETFLEKIKTLKERGDLTSPEYEKYNNDYYKASENLSETLMDISKTSLTEEEKYLDLFEKIAELRLKLIEQKNDLLNLEIEFKDKRYVRSEVNGVVMSVMGGTGKYIAAGKPLLSLAPHSTEKVVYTLFRAFNGKKIEKGMTALSSPTFVNKYQYGSINGTVESINLYPSDKDSILSDIISESWLTQMGFSGDAMIVAKIKLKTVDGEKEKYQWTSSGGPRYPVNSGSFFSIEIDVQKQAPITLVIPLLRELLGVEAR